MGGCQMNNICLLTSGYLYKVYFPSNSFSFVCNTTFSAMSLTSPATLFDSDVEDAFSWVT